MSRLLWIIPALVLAACSESAADRQQRADEVWARLETECDLPCWHGITPGDSIRAEVDGMLTGLEIAAGHECFDFAEAEEQGRAGAYCYWESRAGAPIWGGVFQFQKEGDERLDHILLYLRRPVAFEDGVEHFGEPGAVWAMQHGLQSTACACSGSPPTESEEGGPDFDLLYPERGLILSAYAEQPEQWPCLCRLTWIDAIVLVQPGSGEDLDGWWRSVYGYGLEEEGGRFMDFPGWATPFE